MPERRAGNPGEVRGTARGMPPPVLEGFEETEAAGFDPSDPAALVGETLAGRYRIVEIIGSGGMGTVYRGEHIIIERPVAVKVLLPECRRLPQVRERFYREARITTRIRHPNVLDVSDLGEIDDGRLFLVMELLHGQSLAHRLTGGPLPISQAVEIMIDACEGLGAAHEVGIVHRDVSPSNIFLPSGGGATAGVTRVKLLDFGIAFIKSEVRLTVPGQVMGTPYYMSPEAIGGATAAPSMDVYSLGATLYETLCGEPPFTGTSFAEILGKHLSNPPRPLREHRRDVPEALDALVVACLEKDPGKRPTSMVEVSRGLQVLFREIAAKSRRSVAPTGPRAQALDATVVAGSHAAGSGLTAWKDYLKSVVCARPDIAAAGRSRPEVAEMESAVAELERIDEDLAERREALAQAETRTAEADRRFARAVEALRSEEARLEAAGADVRKALDAAQEVRRAADAPFRDARSDVALAEGVAAADESSVVVPSRSGSPLEDPLPDQALLQAYETAGATAARLREAAAAERACRADRAEWKAQLADVTFQVRQIVASSTQAQEAETTRCERERTEIAAIEEKRSTLWRKLIELASTLSGRKDRT